MKWFNIAKVKNPSKKEIPQGKPVLTLSNEVMDKADIPLYKMLGYGSKIDIYPAPTHFIARQYMIDDKRPENEGEILYAEYRLTLTDEAWRVVDALLKTPFEWDIIQRTGYYYDEIVYECKTNHPVFVPRYVGLYDGKQRWEMVEGSWDIMIITQEGGGGKSRSRIVDRSTMPFNCGPLRPLWEKAVIHWVTKIYWFTSANNTRMIKDKLLEYQYIYRALISTYLRY
ncbi:MAG: hypothetical protein QXS96_04790 [Candidatus Caldarchaeum sp.]